jgi:hypothetical protein
MLYAPRNVSEYINTLIRKGLPYVKGDEEDSFFADPEVGFNCWGFTWHMFEYTGITLSKNPHQARLLFHEVKNPSYRCLVAFKNYSLTEPIHVGFMETHRVVVQCSGTTQGVARLYLNNFTTTYKFYELKDAPSN